MWYEDGGNAVRRLLKEGGEDSMPLTDWVIEPSAVKDHDTQGIWDVSRVALLPPIYFLITYFHSFTGGETNSGRGIGISGKPKAATSFCCLHSPEARIYTIELVTGRTRYIFVC